MPPEFFPQNRDSSCEADNFLLYCGVLVQRNRLLPHQGAYPIARSIRSHAIADSTPRFSRKTASSAQVEIKWLGRRLKTTITVTRLSGAVQFGFKDSPASRGSGHPANSLEEIYPDEDRKIARRVSVYRSLLLRSMFVKRIHASAGHDYLPHYRTITDPRAL